MAVLAIAAAGAALGSYAFAAAGVGTFLGLSGAGWGMMLGSGAANALGFGRPHTDGPRLGELSVQVSSYGRPIPIAYGGIRFAGNIIWSTDLVEHAEDQGGKGGGGVTSFSYSVSCAIAMCEGPIVGIRRIWADTKLVYTTDSAATLEELAASADFARYFTLYLGDEVQAADPNIEAAEGVGNVEAYRGTAYLVFADLPLAEYGNRIPNFSFELTTEEEAEEVTEYLEPRRIAPWRFNPITGEPEPMPPDPTDPAESPTAGYVEAMSYIPLEPSTNTYTTSAGALARAVALATALGGVGNAHGDPLSTQLVGWYTGTNTTLNVFSGGATLDDDPEYVYLVYFVVGINDIDLVSDDAAVGDLGCTELASAGIPIGSSAILLSKGTLDDSNGNGGLHSFSTHTGFVFVNNCFLPWPPEVRAYRNSMNVVRLRRTVRCDTYRCDAGEPCDDVPEFRAQLPDDDDVCISCSGEITSNGELAAEGGTFKQLTLDTFSGGVGTYDKVRSQFAQGPVLRSTDPLYADAGFWADAAAAAAFPVAGTYGVDWPVVVSTVCQVDATRMTRAAGSVLLSDIVSDLCIRAGLRADQIDVTALTDLVPGYVVNRQASARADIEPLRQAYWFDAVESGALIRWVKRGAAPAAALTIDDLGASTSEAGEPLEHDRAQEAELPASVSVAYMAAATDYQTGSQQAKRVTTSSQQQIAVELPIALSDAYAAKVADVLLYDAWSHRTKRSLQTTRKWSKLEPTDVITANDGTYTYTLRILDKREGDGVVRLDCVDDDLAQYSPVALGAPVSGGSGSVKFRGPTGVELLDIPLLRAEDDSAGFYWAAAGYSDGWRGARLFRSLDAGATYASLGDVTTESAIGYAIGALGDFSGGNIVDEINTVEINMRSGTLSSVTRAELFNGANFAVLGDEVLQYQRATLIGTNRYRLSGLLRGRLGTEWAMDEHLTMDRFVVLTASTTQRATTPAAQVGMASVIKAVTWGQTLDAALAIDFTNTAAGAKPLSPVQVRAGTIGGGQQRVQWVRRTRIGGAWVDSTDVPLGEATERYRVRVERAGVEISSTSVLSATADVTAITGDTIYVAQISATVGAGFEASCTVP